MVVGLVSVVLCIVGFALGQVQLGIGAWIVALACIGVGCARLSEDGRRVRENTARLVVPPKR